MIADQGFCKAEHKKTVILFFFYIYVFCWPIQTWRCLLAMAIYSQTLVKMLAFIGQIQ